MEITKGVKYVSDLIKMVPRMQKRLHEAIYKKYNLTSKIVPVDPEAFDSNYRGLTAEIVNPVIEKEIQNIENRYRANEEIYVDENLNETPIPIPWVQEDTSSRLSPDTKCQMINTINQVDCKLRHQYLTKQLSGNVISLQTLRCLIDRAERKLRLLGRSEDDLKSLREAMGIDRIRVKNLEEIKSQLSEKSS